MAEPLRYDEGWHYDDPRLTYDGFAPDAGAPNMNNDRRNYNFTDSLLYQEAERIIAALRGDAAVTARLPANYADDTEALLENAQQDQATREDDTGDLGDQTVAQNNAIREVAKLASLARNTAKRAFRGQTVKLHAEFAVGDTSGNSLPAILTRARTILAGCQKAENVAPLAAKGWPATDTTALETAIETATTADTTQESQKGVKKGDTAEIRETNNTLYENLLTIQQAATNEHRNNTPADIEALTKFRIPEFPPENPDEEEESPPPAPPGP